MIGDLTPRKTSLRHIADNRVIYERERVEQHKLEVLKFEIRRFHLLHQVAMFCIGIKLMWGNHTRRL